MKTNYMVFALILWAAALMLSGCFVPYYDDGDGGYRHGRGHDHHDGGDRRDGGYRGDGERH